MACRYYFFGVVGFIWFPDVFHFERAPRETLSLITLSVPRGGPQHHHRFVPAEHYRGTSLIMQRPPP